MPELVAEADSLPTQETRLEKNAHLKMHVIARSIYHQ
jgi:hypothetical protein